MLLRVRGLRHVSSDDRARSTIAWSISHDRGEIESEAFRRLFARILSFFDKAFVSTCLQEAGSRWGYIRATESRALDDRTLGEIKWSRRLRHQCSIEDDIGGANDKPLYTSTAKDVVYQQRLLGLRRSSCSESAERRQSINERSGENVVQNRYKLSYRYNLVEIKI